MTLVVQIGNTDNKLTQQEWSHFVSEVTRDLDLNGNIHFAGGSPTECKWQNYCWVVEYPEDEIGNIKTVLSKTGKYFRQDSVAVTVGETEFV